MFEFLKKLVRGASTPDPSAIVAAALDITTANEIVGATAALVASEVDLRDAVVAWFAGRTKPEPATCAAAIWLAHRITGEEVPGLEDHLVVATQYADTQQGPTMELLRPAVADAATNLAPLRRESFAVRAFLAAGESDQRFRLLKVCRSAAMMEVVVAALDDLPERQIAVVSTAFRTSFDAADVPVLLATYQPDGPGAEAFLSAFGAVGDARFAPALVVALEDRRDRVRYAARRALLKMQATATTEVIEALGSPRKAARLQAAEVIARWELTADLASAVRAALHAEKVAEVRDLMLQIVPMSGDLNLKTLQRLREKLPEDVARAVRDAIARRRNGEMVDFAGLIDDQEALLAIAADALQGAPGGADRCMDILAELLDAAPNASLGPWVSAWFLRSVKPLYSEARPLPVDAWFESHRRFGSAGVAPLVELLLEYDVHFGGRAVHWLLTEYAPTADHARLVAHPDAQFRASVAETISQHGAVGLVEFIAPMLDDARKEIRAAAAEALGGLGGAAAIAALEARVAKERASATRQAIEAALTRIGLNDLTGEEESLADVAPTAANHLRIDARLAAIPTRPKFAVDELPQLRWSSGSPMSAGAQRWLISMLEQSDFNVPDADMLAMRQHINAVDAKRVLETLRAAFDAEDRAVRLGWVLFATAVLGNDDQIESLGTGLDKMARSGHSEQAFRRLEVLEQAGTHGAIGWLDHWFRKARSHGLRDRAEAALRRIAVARGVSLDDLADLVFDDYGLDEHGQRVFRIGDREVITKFDVTSEVGILKDGRLTPRFPHTLAADDATEYERVHDEYRAWRKALQRALKGQIDRLEWAMIWGRRWTPDAFAQTFRGHPVLSEIARNVLWTAWSEGQTTVVRLENDGSFSTVDDDTYAGAVESLSIAHPVDFAPGDAERWLDVFVDYLLVQPFSQIDRPTRAVQPVGELLVFADIDGEPMRERVLNAGWRRDEVEDSGLVTSFARTHPNGIAVVASLDPGLYVAKESPSIAQDVLIEFSRDTKTIPLADVPRCLLAEVAWEVAGPEEH